MGKKKKKNKEAASGKKQPLLVKQDKEVENAKTEVVAITTEDKRLLLLVGNEIIEISDYQAKSFANGITELHVVIKGKTVSTELSANSRK